MAKLLYSSSHVVFNSLRNCMGRFRGTLAALLLLLPVACGVAAAQNTTISGTVYDPRGASRAPPLPNVLVYASTTTVSAPASGVQCLTAANQTPTGANVVSLHLHRRRRHIYADRDSRERDSYTIVIQAGKWQRQFTETVGRAAHRAALGMPANHTQGNIPMIAIATGSVDGAECVLRDMGISDSEFTDDNGQ